MKSRLTPIISALLILCGAARTADSKPNIVFFPFDLMGWEQPQSYTAGVGKWHLGLAWGKEDKGVPPVGARYIHGPTELGFDYFCGYTHATTS